MKKLMIVMATLTILFACNNSNKPSDEGATETQTIPAEWVEVVFNVEGMTCDGCENAIKAGIETLNGIASVESSHEEGWTRVQFDKNLTCEKDIEGKITDTGYIVEGENGNETL